MGKMFVKNLFGKVESKVPTYQGGASWRQSRRWGGFVMLLIAAASISLALPNAASAASPSISLSQSTNTVNISIPTGGGIGVSGHTLTATTDSQYGYTVTMRSKTDNANLLLNGTDTNNKLAPVGDNKTLASGQWGYTLTNPVNDTNKATAIWSPLQPSLQTGDTIMESNNSASITKTINYGARVDDGKSIKSGNYKAEVEYTATAALAPPATITSISPKQFYLGSGNDGTVAITGTNLANATAIYVDMNGDRSMSADEQCRDLEQDKDVSVTDDDIGTASTPANRYLCTMPTDVYRASLGSSTNAGSYAVIVNTDGAQREYTVDGGYTYKEPTADQQGLSICRNGDSNSACQVDTDANMVPVKYVGTHKTPAWAVVTHDEIANNKGVWYDYGNGLTARDGGGAKWANAVTLTSSSFAKYKNAKSGTDKNVQVNNDDVLSYLTYIPRYAYEVMRLNGTDRVVSTPQNFDIRFEKSDVIKKTPAESCNPINPTTSQMWINGTPNNVESNIKAKDYRAGCGISRTYGAATGTTWATHPAFTWLWPDSGKTVEYNGFWVSKYDATGKAEAATSKPNQVPNGTQYVGSKYSASKNVGATDPSNTYGGSSDQISYKSNSNNLNSFSGHMLKADEYGAMVYLSASSYGAGVGNVQRNLSQPFEEVGSSLKFITDQDGNEMNRGVTGCGPHSNGVDSFYRDGQVLTQSSYEASTDGCSKSYHERNYNGIVGVLASTSGTVYGLYDLNGGSSVILAGNGTNNASQSYSDYTESGDLSTPIKPPYVNLYIDKSAGGRFVDRPSWTDTIPSDYNPSETNIDFCTWTSCGGQALHELKRLQVVLYENGSMSASGQMWYEQSGELPHSVCEDNNPCMEWLSKAGNMFDVDSAGGGPWLGGDKLGYRFAIHQQ